MEHWHRSGTTVQGDAGLNHHCVLRHHYVNERGNEFNHNRRNLNNNYKNALRTKSRRPVKFEPTSEDDDIEDHYFMTHTTPEDVALDQMTHAMVRGAVESLPESFREAVLLKDVEDFSYGEIADILEVPLGTVMSRIHRGRKLLQKTLYEYALQEGLIATPA